MEPNKLTADDTLTEIEKVLNDGNHSQTVKLIIISEIIKRHKFNKGKAPETEYALYDAKAKEEQR